jgi:glycosyltransferase involved in cell wall biosynthesis
MRRLAMRIVNVSECAPDWNWIQPSLAALHPGWQWRHAAVGHPPLPRWLPKRYALSRMTASFRGVGWCDPGDVLVTHGPRLAFYSQVAMWLRRRRPHHVAYTFSFTDLPVGVERRAMRRALRGVDRFVCFSQMERQLYAEHFDLDIERFEAQFWGVGEPPVEPGGPFVAGDYVCALGMQARDYATLVEAMRGLPAIRMVLVTLPSALAGLDLPPNVEVHSGIALARAMNILAHSRFTVLPLRGRRVPCGHSTIVPAMQLGKAIVATDSAGVGEYVFPHRNGLTVAPHDSVAMRTAIETLYEDPALAARLGRGGRAFAQENCSERTVADWFSRYVGARFPADSLETRPLAAIAARAPDAGALP